MPVPIALLVDDPTPVIHLYRHHIGDIHGESIVAAGGKELVETIPNAFLDRFCAVVEERGIRGKFSIVPSPMGRGDVVRGLEGRDPGLVKAWMDTVKARLTGRMDPSTGSGSNREARFDFGPEMITHSWAVDLATGGLLKESEHDWSQRQDRKTLTPYIARALSLLKEAGIDASGVTSPWMFAEKVEKEYAAAIAAAQMQVYGRKLSWYFLQLSDDRAVRPSVMYRDGESTVVSIPACSDDLLWDTIWKHAGKDPAVVAALADKYLTADGRGGLIREVLDGGGWPIFVMHWQTLYSNGAETGLAVLDTVAERVNHSLAGKVEWMTCLEMAEITA